jgi:hypothetical protein
MGKAAQYLSVGELESIAENLFIVKSRRGGELIGLCPNHEASLISGQFSVACHFSGGGQVAAPAIPGPFLKKKYKPNSNHPENWSGSGAGPSECCFYRGRLSVFEG